MVLVVFPASYSAIVDGCNGKLHAWYCHWPVINAAFAVKVAISSMVGSTQR